MMSLPTPVPDPIRLGRFWSVSCVAILAAYLAIVVVPAGLNPNTDGFAAYYTASRILLRNPAEVGRVYDDPWFQSKIDEFGFRHVRDIYNVNPPTMALLMLPVARLSPSAARVVWIALSVAFWLCGISVLYRALSTRPARFHAMLLLAASTTTFPPLRENIIRGQCYGFLFFLLALHFQLLLRRNNRASWAAGLPLGCMLILKSAGAWLLPLLLLSRRWSAVVAAAATCLAVALLFYYLGGWSAWPPYFHLLPRLASHPLRYVSAYQTVAGLLGHLFVFDDRFNPHPIAHLPLLASLSTTAVIIAALVESVRHQRLNSDSLAARALSIGMFGSLIVTVAPVAEGYHYLLVLPTVIIAWWWTLTARRDISSLAAVATGTVLLMIPQKVYFSSAIQSGWLALFAYPRVYGAFVLWTWLRRALKVTSAS
jgi:hypothetical protein